MAVVLPAKNVQMASVYRLEFTNAPPVTVVPIINGVAGPHVEVLETLVKAAVGAHPGIRSTYVMLSQSAAATLAAPRTGNASTESVYLQELIGVHMTTTFARITSGAVEILAEDLETQEKVAVGLRSVIENFYALRTQAAVVIPAQLLTITAVLGQGMARDFHVQKTGHVAEILAALQGKAVVQMVAVVSCRKQTWAKGLGYMSDVSPMLRRTPWIM
ncbi:hypothetical protein TWF718_005760 [Orbilia javanica]|uniref:Uncharacterized protein n=1 Tax=Orbilia javanica TaxID=47235 RepID=A0AAN8N887_9PEZI